MQLATAKEMGETQKQKVMLKIIIVVLNLAKLSVSLLGQSVKFIVESINGSAYFITPNPLVDAAGKARGALADAVTNYELAPSKENKKIVKDCRKALMAAMELVRQFVQGIARLNPEFAENIAAAAGLTLKKSGGRKVQGYAVMNTAVSGTVSLLAALFKIAIYNWEMTLTPLVDASWIPIGITNKAELMISGLTSGKRYYFRVGNGGDPAKEVFITVGNTVVL